MRSRTALTALAAVAAAAVTPTLATAQNSVWGSKGAKPGQFGKILDVATDAKGYVYVLDEPDRSYNSEGRVQKFLPSGRLVRQWGLPSDDDVDPLDRPNLIANPVTMAVSPQGTVFVAERGERTRISAWTTRGKYVRAFSSGGEGPGQIQNVEGMDIAADGKLLVANNGKISVFTQGGRPAGERTVSLPPDPDGYSYSYSPGHFAAARDGRLFMSAPTGVLLTDAAATPIGAFGGEGEGPGQFGNATDVAVGGNAVYVTDSQLSRVQRFDMNGNYIGPVGTSPGAGRGQFSRPTSVAVDCQGAAYVADTGNYRIQRFNASGPACSKFSKDRAEGFAVGMAGPRVQNFREEFAVQPRILCDRPCQATLTGTIVIPGRKPIRLITERFRVDYPDLYTANIAPNERGTDQVVAALRGDRRATARIRLVARDLTGKRVIRNVSYRLR